MSETFRATVAYDWQATEATEMNIIAGEELIISSVNERGWALAQNADGISGWVPVDFLNRVEDDHEGMAQQAEVTSLDYGDELSIAVEQIQIADDTSNLLTCFNCNNPIDGNSLSTKGRHFHPDCFNCNVCSTSLVNVGFLEKDNIFYCEKDYYQSHGQICAHCNDTIMGPHIMGNGKPYHMDHLLCMMCNVSIGTELLHVKDDKTYCQGCYESNFSTKCAECNEVIEHHYFSAFGKNFHRECFKCSFDGHVLEGENFLAHEDKPYCEAHYQQMFGKTCNFCNLNIDGQYFQVSDKTFHPECWKCTECQADLNAGCVKRGEKFYCPPCGSKVPNTPSNAAKAPTKAPTAAPTAAPVAAPTPAPVAAPKPAPAAAPAPAPVVAPAAVPKPTVETKPVTPVKPAQPAAQPQISADVSSLLSAAGINIESLAQPEAAPAVIPESQYYSLEELQNNEILPPSVNRNKKEDYLTDEDFEKYFKMTREKFAAHKAWKQAEVKKSLKIF